MPVRTTFNEMFLASAFTTTTLTKDMSGQFFSHFLTSKLISTVRIEDLEDIKRNTKVHMKYRKVSDEFVYVSWIAMCHRDKKSVISFKSAIKNKNHQIQLINVQCQMWNQDKMTNSSIFDIKRTERKG